MKHRTPKGKRMDDAMKHLPYEIDMLFESFERYPKIDPTDKILRRALIESFCVHARLLFELFEKEPKNRLYTTGYRWVKNPRTYGRRLNNQIAHLGYMQRTSDISKLIDYPMRLDMLNRIRVEVTNFKAFMKDRALAQTIPEVPLSEHTTGSLSFSGTVDTTTGGPLTVLTTARSSN
jgi:hypothetical protein